MFRLNDADILNQSFIEETPVKLKVLHQAQPEGKENKNTINNAKNDPLSTSFKNMRISESKHAAPVFQSKSYPFTKKEEDNLEPSNPSRTITPKVMSFMRIRRPKSSSKKKLKVLEHEFKTKKVLFQTPISFPRPQVLPNESLTLSMIDTPERFQRRAPNDPRVESKPYLASFNLTVKVNGVDYFLDKQLGSGGSSSVFLAKRIRDKVECALKIVNLKGEKNIVESYMNETNTLVKLQGNKSIVNLYDHELRFNESRLYMVMEKGDIDFNKVLQSYTTDIPLYELVDYFYQMLKAVHFIHKNGVIHSDLKPANFLMINGRLKLIDFGIASHLEEDATSMFKYSQAGTLNYISPEALIDISTDKENNGQPKIKISFKSDVWSLGCILYLLLYKKTPFSDIKNMLCKYNVISNPATVIEYKELPSHYPKMLSDVSISFIRGIQAHSKIRYLLVLISYTVSIRFHGFSSIFK